MKMTYAPITLAALVFAVASGLSNAQDSCTWEAVSSCTSEMGSLQDSDGDMQRICQVMSDAGECFSKIQPLCTETNIKKTVDEAVMKINTQVDSCQGNCSWMAVSKCNEPLENIETELDIPTKCEKAQKVVDCMSDIYPSCTDETIKNQINMTLGYIMPEMDRNGCHGEGHSDNADSQICSWTTFSTCTGKLQSLSKPEPDLLTICPILTESSECLSKMMPFCTDDSLKTHTNNTLIAVNKGLGSCQGDCTWITFHGCIAPIGALFADQDIDMNEICPIISNARDCVLEIQPACANDDIKQAVDRSVYDIRMGYSNACTGDCTWPAAAKCHETLEDIEYELDIPAKCKKAQIALDCMVELYPSCSDVDIKKHFQSTTYHIKREMEKYMCHGETPNSATQYPNTTIAHSMTCDWNTYQQCAALMDHGSGSMEDICHSSKRTMECFEKMMPFCTDETLKETSESMMRDSETRIDHYCHFESACKYEDIEVCVDPIKEKPTMAKQCMMASWARDCTERQSMKCNHQPIVKEEVWGDTMRWLENFWNKCVSEGYYTGGGSDVGDGDYGHTSKGKCVQPSILVFFVTFTMVVAKFISRV